ncbi:peptide deformylase [Peptostreptococcus stomatis]|uniref:Peptide deformylase n=1 Tax=Peptostreptococcus stomatis DSM 17678 TaxID=596315 RepID=E0E4G5_9FIRM|nr:peptide deformylase [Peptostreptococcus stomatis]EFM64226.1 peptide deformylase [Peptostreptococcus stomatis DSM 17678]MBL6465687.1 peptide deformylase [Peptostreptococcus stomatis]
MAIRNILKMGEPLLNKKSKQVVDFNDRLHTLLDDMADTMYKEDGVGLAAPQVGVLRRAVVVDIGEGLIELINPVIVETSGEQTDLEGCLSVVDYIGEVTRPNYVKVKAQDRFGKDIEVEGEGFLARAFCHEIDHLEGILFVERVEDTEKGE